MRAIQTALIGEDKVIGNLEDRIEYILEMYPETQGDYKALWFRLCMEFYGLRDILRSGDWSRFEHWYRTRAPSQKTVNNRCGEIQNRRPDLEPAEVREKRLKQSRQGRIK